MASSMSAPILMINMVGRPYVSALGLQLIVLSQSMMDDFSPQRVWSIRKGATCLSRPLSLFKVMGMTV
jgi:hypothetical protein